MSIRVPAASVSLLTVVVRAISPSFSRERPGSGSRHVIPAGRSSGLRQSVEQSDQLLLFLLGQPAVVECLEVLILQRIDAAEQCLPLAREGSQHFPVRL